MTYSNLQIYKDFSALAKPLKRRIRQMSREYKFDIGFEMKQLIRDIKYQIYYANSRQNDEKSKELSILKDMINHLKILIGECVDDNIFVLRGKGSVGGIIKELKNVSEQANKWKKYFDGKNHEKFETHNVTYEDKELPF